jgi:hypothetical protein
MSHKDFPTPTCFCLRCGHTFDRASNLTGTGEPKPGDLTLCIGCGQMLRFNEDMTVGIVNKADEFANLTPSQHRKVAIARIAIGLISLPKETKQ